MASKKETKMVTVIIPLTKDNQEDVFASVNGRRYQIKRGKQVEVPDYVAEVLKRSEESDVKAFLRRRQLQNK